MEEKEPKKELKLPPLPHKPIGDMSDEEIVDFAAMLEKRLAALEKDVDEELDKKDK